jgi:hypothetical protein
VLRVREEREGKVVLLLELHVLRLAVGRDAEHDGTCALELGVRVADPLGLHRAAGSVVLGIEVEDDRLAAKIGEADALTGVGRCAEVGCRLALGDHVRSVVGAGQAPRQKKAGRPGRKRPASSGDDRVRDPSGGVPRALGRPTFKS